jgi:hypothetical protein
MQRKLFRSMTALSVTASVFALLLLAAGPATAPTILPDARGVALASADAAAEPALDAAADPVSAAARQRHHLHRARSLLALPYFSFAQGLRHGRS